MREQRSMMTHFALQPPSTLYHYTSLEAFMSIVGDGVVWASNLRYLNDSSEYAFLVKLIQKRVFELANGNLKHDSEMLLALYKRLEERSNDDAFVASFTERRDDLSQWRAYSLPGQGVCIGFKSSALQKLATFQNQADPVHDGVFILAKVIYESKNNGPSFDEAISHAIHAKIPQVSDEVPSLEFALAAFTNFAPFYKDMAFRDEAEWRIVAGKSFITGKPKELAFRVGKSTLIPFTKLHLEKCSEDFLAEVIVGPSPNQNLSLHSVEQFVREHIKSEVAVVPSDIPWRHW